MKTRRDWDIFFMKVAREAAKLSYDKIRKVGAVVTMDNNILSFSYNGTAPGQDNTMRDAEGKTLPNVFHAEAHALGKITRSTLSSVGSTIYTTLSPCWECSKLIALSGVRRVVYDELYKLETLDWLNTQGIETEQLYVYRKPDPFKPDPCSEWFGADHLYK